MVSHFTSDMLIVHSIIREDVLNVVPTMTGNRAETVEFNYKD
jgi:hypothetical protein